MNRPIITVEGLGKQYAIGAKPASYRTLREALMEGLKTPVRRLRAMRGHAGQDNLIWALKDVSFEIQEGEVVGIIGRNGAGKSTLLKILSRITDPTQGWAEIHGRVASLLEVGTGFHHELTGRENIYLNGAILGMRKAEIERKFDEIVDFAEIEPFIDTPVKHFSSGMYVRLAFAVAAHLEPEILIVDEVLAVGDIAFQKKCLGKMEDISSRSGRTVLFVSHNMQSIRALSHRGIVLNGGMLTAFSNVETAVRLYNDQVFKTEITATYKVEDETFRRGSGAARITSAKVLDSEARPRQIFERGETVRFLLTYKVFRPIENLFVAVALRSGRMGEIITNLRHRICDSPVEAGEAGTIEIDLPNVGLRPGEFSLYLWLGNRHAQPYDVVDGILPPLVIHARKNELTDFAASQHVGFFDIPYTYNRLA